MQLRDEREPGSLRLKMSTLPRTRSLSGADTRSLSLNYRDKKRPASLCEASWNKVDPNSGPLQDRLRRIPSQANNLCTTVPTSLVSKPLGGRHTPTRNSLRHSRMAVMARTTSKGVNPRRWTSGGIGRVASLVIIAHILVGVVGVFLAIWLLQWAPSLPFREIPHYAGVTVVASGILASVLMNCLSKSMKYLAQVLKVILIILLLTSIISCSSVCVFDTLHLVNLAPMECSMRSDVIIHPTSHENDDDSSSVSPISNNADVASDISINIMERIEMQSDSEGSGNNPDDHQFMDDEEDFPVVKELEISTQQIPSFRARIRHEIKVNASVCVCNKRKEGWRIVTEYPNLTCNEVKNILPIFFVASCVVTVVGGVLSAVLLYLLWVSRKRPYGSIGITKTSEVKPFIFKSNFKNTQIKDINASTTNGNYLYR